MNNDAGGNRGPRRAGLLAALAAIAVLATACSSSSPSNSADSATGGSANYTRELAFAQCMRSHGVPNFPDPLSNGDFVMNGSPVVSKSVEQAAMQACQHLLPNGAQSTAAKREQKLQLMLRFAQCMRTHGVPNYPDPPANGSGGGLVGAGLNTQSPQFQAAQRDCQSVMAGGGNGAAG